MRTDPPGSSSSSAFNSADISLQRLPESWTSRQALPQEFASPSHWLKRRRAVAYGRLSRIADHARTQH
jgi:hypothetical protein